jgi:hypothetical protein
MRAVKEGANVEEYILRDLARFQDQLQSPGRVSFSGKFIALRKTG